MEWQWFLALLLLACPLAMFWMMRGTSHGEEGRGSEAVKGDAAAPETAPLSADEEIEVVRERLPPLEE